MNSDPIEQLRRIWTPDREVQEIYADTEPQTELDSLIRDLLHRVVQQRGPVTLNYSALNTGVLRWEIIYNGQYQEISLWVE